MKKKSSVQKTALLMTAALFCFSCSTVPSSSEEPSSSQSSLPTPTFSVYLIPDEAKCQILSENPVNVQRGKDATFLVRVEEGYGIHSLTRQGEEAKASFSTDIDDITTITIPNIRFSARYDINVEEARYEVDYYPNGGEYIEEGIDASKPFKKRYSLRHRLRPNTELGTDRFKREGYVLSGWNTSPDGSGERTGLGSRVTPPEGNALALYATWEKEAPAEQFSSTTKGGEAYITKYLGSDERVVVPSHIGGVEVTTISTGAFSGNEKAVVLPSGIIAIEDGAFQESKIQELYCYDNLLFVSDDAFLNCPNFSTIHINAIQPPRYGGGNMYSEINFADKYDILILNKNKKKLIVFGGSGAYFSVDTNRIEEALNDGTVCINMAVNGWFNGMAQFDMMMPYLQEGDAFIHAPETSSQFGFLRGITMIPGIRGFTYNQTRLYSCIESNYDLLGLVDFRHVEDLLTGFALFNSNRRTMTPTTYEDYKTTLHIYGQTYQDVDLAYIDKRGNFPFAKPAKSNPGEAGEADIVVEYIEDEAGQKRFNETFDRLRAKGVVPYLTTAPINRDTLQLRLDHPELFHDVSTEGYLYYGRPDDIPDPNYPSLDNWVQTFEAAVASYLDIEVLVPLSNTIYQTDDYFEPDYHLGDQKSLEYTMKLSNAYLQKRGGRA